MIVLKRIALGTTILLLSLAIAIGLGLWRVQDAPVSAEFARSLIERQLNKAAPGSTLIFTKADIHWIRKQDNLQIRFENATLESDLHNHPISAGQVNIKVDATALLAGKLRLRTLSINGAQTRIDWNIESGRKGAPLSYADLRRQILVLSNKLTAIKELKKLNHITIDNSEIHFLEGASGARHQFQLNTGYIDKTHATLQGRLHSQTGGGRFKAEIDFQHHQADLAVTSPMISNLLNPLPLKGWGSAFNMPVKAALTANIVENSNDDSIHMSFNLGAGAFSHTDIYPNPRDFERALLEATLKPLQQSASLKTLVIEFAGATLSLEGEGFGAIGAPNVQLNGRLDGLNVASLKTYWPPHLAPGGYDWITENIEDGYLPNGRLSFAVDADMWESGLPKNALQFDFDIRDLTAHYRRPMPPLVNAHGRGVLSLNGLDLFIDKGEISGVDVSASQVILSQFSSARQWADIALFLKGPVSKVLKVLDSEPLGYISSYGIDPNAAFGYANATTSIRLPLLKDLLLEDVAFEGRIETQGLGLRDLVGPDGLKNGSVIFLVDGDSLDAQGTIDLLNIPTDVHWREDFRETSIDPTWVKLNTVISDADLRRLGLETEPRLQGSIALNLTSLGTGAEIRSGTITADFQNAVLDEPILNWVKPKGEDAVLHSDFTYLNGVFALTNAEFNGTGLQTRFNMQFNDLDNAQLNMPTIKYGRNDFSLDATVANKQWTIAIKGRALDVEPLLDALYAIQETPDQKEPTPWPDFQGTVALDRLELANETALIGMGGAISVYNDHITSMNLQGSLEGQAPFELHLLETEDYVRQLGLSASDAGLAAKALDIFTKGSGGSLTVSAEIRGRQDGTEIDGLATMNDFRLTEAPVLARILSVASLSGVADLARDGRIEFRNMRLPFTLRDGVIDIDEASANGPALGLTMDGQFVQSLAEADLRGVIVPAYGFNSIIGRVPFLGDLITGGENEGVFAIDYRISGDLTDPDINVNPATMLAPGILRKIFTTSKGQLPSIKQEESLNTPSSP